LVSILDTSVLTALSVAVSTPCKETAFVGIDKSTKEIFAKANRQLGHELEKDHESNLPKHHSHQNPFKKLNDAFKGTQQITIILDRYPTSSNMLRRPIGIS
jgi:hypothetical protein